MRHTKKVLALGFSLLALTCMAQKTNRLKPVKWISTAIPEPSDIAYSTLSGSFFVISDNGILFETDAEGKILRKITEANTDFEAVYADSTFVYAVDETHRNIHRYDRTSFKHIGLTNLPYQGGRNAGYEAFTFNPVSRTFVLITEKNPVTLFELDTKFSIKNQTDLSAIARDISAATYHDNFLWLLSDEDRTIFKLDPISFEVRGKWLLPVINPEGLAFDHNGNLLITCDDMQRIYYFINPEKL